MRHLSIDILRTAAIFMMVLVHFVENLSATYDTQDSGGHPLTPWWLPSGLAAPLFTLLTGGELRDLAGGAATTGASQKTRSIVAPSAVACF